jgi:hypothetical protein
VTQRLRRQFHRPAEVTIQLIRNKRAAAPPEDLSDIDALEHGDADR